MPRKHLIASGINKKQQLQAKLWMKCAKEIKAAVRVGGTNPDANARLKSAIVRALQNNLSRDSIQKNISGAEKDTSIMKELYYEGYGPNGVAILIKALTDNEQRTISSLRGYFSKLKGQIAKPNSVMMLFDELGEFVFDKLLYTEDQILDKTISYDIVNLIDDEDCYILTVKPAVFFDVKECLDKNSMTYLSAEIKYLPNQTVSLNAEDKERFERFITNCDEDEDIQWIVNNCSNC